MGGIFRWQYDPSQDMTYLSLNNVEIAQIRKIKAHFDKNFYVPKVGIINLKSHYDLEEAKKEILNAFRLEDADISPSS
jgi:hypothetical protein